MVRAALDLANLADVLENLQCRAYTERLQRCGYKSDVQAAYLTPGLQMLPIDLCMFLCLQRP